MIFAHSFEEKNEKRRSSILAFKCNEQLVHLVASVAHFDDISTYVMRRCGLNIFSLSNEEAGEVPFLQLAENTRWCESLRNSILKVHID